MSNLYSIKEMKNLKEELIKNGSCSSYKDTSTLINFLQANGCKVSSRNLGYGHITDESSTWDGSDIINLISYDNTIDNNSPEKYDICYANGLEINDEYYEDEMRYCYSYNKNTFYILGSFSQIKEYPQLENLATICGSERPHILIKEFNVESIKKVCLALQLEIKLDDKQLEQEINNTIKFWEENGSNNYPIYIDWFLKEII
jgi:hypothetical protein